MFAFCIDRAGALDQLEKTPQGGYRANATIARVGILLYTADELRRQGLPVNPKLPATAVLRVYNPPEVLQAAMDSLKDAPVTRDHPRRFVSPQTYSTVAAGTVSAGTVRFEDGMLKASVTVQDAKLLEDIELGVRREVSAGYRHISEMRSGVTSEGETYDAVRTAIEYNHVAIVARGRAGQKVCLALDSEFIPKEGEIVELKIKGVAVAAENAQAAIDAATVEASDSLNAAKAELEVTKAKLAAAEVKLAEAEAKATDAAIDAVVEARLVKRDAERAAAEEAEKRKSAVRAAGLDVDKMEGAVIDAAYALLQADDGAKRLLGQVPSAAPTPAKPAEPKLDPRAAMIAKQRAMLNAK